MQRFAVVLAVGNQRLPGLRLVQRAGFNRLADELCTLGVDLAAAERVVADLGVSQDAMSLSRFGVFACLTASPLPPSPRPTPSMMTNTMGFFICISSIHVGFFLFVPILHHFVPVYNVNFPFAAVKYAPSPGRRHRQNPHADYRPPPARRAAALPRQGLCRQ